MSPKWEGMAGASADLPQRQVQWLCAIEEGPLKSFALVEPEGSDLGVVEEVASSAPRRTEGCGADGMAMNRDDVSAARPPKGLGALLSSVIRMRLYGGIGAWQRAHLRLGPAHSIQAKKRGQSKSYDDREKHVPHVESFVLAM